MHAGPRLQKQPATANATAHTGSDIQKGLGAKMFEGSKKGRTCWEQAPVEYSETLSCEDNALVTTL